MSQAPPQLMPSMINEVALVIHSVMATGTTSNLTVQTPTLSFVQTSKDLITVAACALMLRRIAPS